jgi:ribonucleoside-triphosphate reductase
MRNLEVIESELSAAREALSNVTGTPAEVYSRIVGYYRSVRNWNRGKREEYGERVLFEPDQSLLSCCMPAASGLASPLVEQAEGGAAPSFPAEKADSGADRILLFVRPACPACPSAKSAAGQLGLPLELYNADTDEGLAEAVRHNVMSTPTAILLSAAGEELARARDVQAIAELRNTVRQPVAV